MADPLTGSSPAGSQPLRIGILIDSFQQPAWVARALEFALASRHVELALVVRRVGPVSAAAQEKRQALLARLYARLDERLFPLASDPLALVDIEPLLAGCPRIDVVPRETPLGDYLSDADADAIDAYGLDVAVRFGFRNLRGRALQIARHGAWAWHHGDDRSYRGGPPGFREVMEGVPATRSTLEILSEDPDSAKVVYGSWSRADRRSVRRNATNYYWKSALFLRRALDRLHEQGEPVLVESDAPRRPSSNRLHEAPTNRDVLGGVARVAARYAHDKTRAMLSPEQWFIAYGLDPESASPDVPETAPYRFRELLPPEDRFWADPFPVVRAGRHWIFFEERIGRGPGHIEVVEVGPEGIIGRPSRALERPYHLSYPFVFEWQGETYMVPETEQHRAIELYRAEEFPTRWTLDRVLLSGLRAVDATLVEIAGRWWMFVNVAESEEVSLNDELHLYSAESPLGPWVPHPQNPVKSDVRSARPAGRLFHFRGAWYRPSQDCSERYGGAIVVNRITRLDESEYAEEEVARLVPDWRPNLVATHTLNAAGGLTVIDAQRLRRRWVRSSGLH